MSYPVICPECGAEYLPGVSECADCQVPLVVASPLEFTRTPPPRPDVPLNLKTVLKLTSPDLIELAKSLLEEAEIPFLVANEMLHGVFPNLGIPNPMIGPVLIQVPASQVAQANEALAAYDFAQD